MFHICTIDLNFWKLIEIYFTASSIGTTDDTVLSVVRSIHHIYHVIRTFFSLISFSFSEVCSPLLLVARLYSSCLTDFSLVLVVLAGVWSSHISPYRSCGAKIEWERANGTQNQSCAQNNIKASENKLWMWNFK